MIGPQVLRPKYNKNQNIKITGKNKSSEQSDFCFCFDQRYKHKNRPVMTMRVRTGRWLASNNSPFKNHLTICKNPKESNLLISSQMLLLRNAESLRRGISQYNNRIKDDRKTVNSLRRFLNKFLSDTETTKGMMAAEPRAINPKTTWEEITRLRRMTAEAKFEI